MDRGDAREPLDASRVEPDADQQAVLALPASASALVVGAGGTGKTATILARASRLLRSGAVPPDELLVLTPSRQTATALRDRVDRDLDIATAGPLARSVASFAFQLVGSAAAAASAPPPQLLSAADQDQIIADLLDGDEEDASEGRSRWPEALGPTVRRSRAFRAELRALMAQCAERGITAAELAALAHARGVPAWAAAASFLEEYRYTVGRMRPHHRDPAELIAEAAALLASHRVLAGIPQVLLVDDAHELSAGAVALVAAARARGVAVVAAGDPDQGASSFRGAGPDTFRRLIGVLGEPLVLRAQHRAADELTQLARTVTTAIGAAGVVSHRIAPRAASDVSTTPRPAAAAERIAVLVEPSGFAELDAIAHTLRSWHLREGMPWSRMTVIAHDTRQVARYEVELAARDVPTRAPRTARPLGSEPAVRHLLEIVRLGLIAPEERAAAALEQALCSLYGGMDAVGLRRLRGRLRTAEFASGGGRSAEELVVEALAEPAQLMLLDTREARSAERVAGMLADVHRLHALGASPHELLWAVWARSGREREWAARAQGSGPDAAAAARALDALVALFAAAKRASERAEVGVEGFVREVLHSDVPDDLLAAVHRRQSVEVLTPAAALGREFDGVIIAGVQEGVWPNTRLRGGLLDGWRLADEVDAWRVGRMPSELAVQDRRRAVLHEELRLFLRALTRARDRLVVTAVADDDTSPSVLLGFLPAPSGSPPDRHPLTLRGAVASARRVLTTSTDQLARDRAARTLAVLARAGVPGAHPDQWYGVRPPSGRPAVHDPAAGPLTLSPSRLEAFEECAVDWAVRQLGGEKKSFSAGVGTILHAAMEASPDGTFDQLDAVVEERWGELSFDADWLSRQERQWARLLSERLAVYLRETRAEGGRAVGAETRFRLEIHATDPAAPVAIPGDLDAGPAARGARAVLSGSIDRVERYDSADMPPRIVVVDLKTGRSESRVTDAKVTDDAQLAAYQLAVASGAIPGCEDAELVGARLLVLSKTLKGTAYRLAQQHALDEQQRTAFLQRVIADAAAMAASSFSAYPDAHCNDATFGVCRVHTVKPVSAS